MFISQSRMLSKLNISNFVILYVFSITVEKNLIEIN